MSERMVWNGIRFYRYPESKYRTDRVYWSPGITDRQAGVRRLHEMIWQAEHGPIPEGHHVHHADHDPMNNDPANLVLMTESDHHQHHMAERVADGTAPTFTDAARAKAAEWHGSAEGLAWHREHGARTWEGARPADRTCQQCGNGYESRARQAHDRFCSNKCRAAARRASGVDDEDRTCQRCGAAFRCNRYLKTRNCSRSCAMRKS